MTDEARSELIKFCATAGLVMLEWYAMQPYHVSLYAAFWARMTVFFQRLASFFGMLAIGAEHNYYMAVGHGS